ncbi:MAG: nucleoside phosphorylase [Flavobacteriales bacterium]|nr:nucleoside phosphorylase [Flavobacteriales bacterium]
MERIAESELVLNENGSVYHLNLLPENIADTIILVGDQGRVGKISQYFDVLEYSGQKREFLTHTGRIGSKRLSVLSTGIGTDNIDIVINELDALVNIDLDSRTARSETKSLNLIRLGTSGSLQEDLPVDSFLLSTHGIGFDGVLNYYAVSREIEDAELTDEFVRQMNWHEDFPRPYIVKGSEKLFDLLKDGTHHGMTATANGFYGPQGRQLRLKARVADLNERLMKFNYNGHRITNFEMETSALFGLGKALGHECATVCAIIANRFRKEYSKNHDLSVEQLIGFVVDRLT